MKATLVTPAESCTNPGRRTCYAPGVGLVPVAELKFVQHGFVNK